MALRRNRKTTDQAAVSPDATGASGLAETAPRSSRRTKTAKPTQAPEPAPALDEVDEAPEPVETNPGRVIRDHDDEW